MNDATFMAILIVASISIPYIYQNKIRNNLLRELYKYKANQQKEEFFGLLDSFQSKFCLSTFTIMFMKFNYFLDFGEYDNAKEMYNKIIKQKMNNKNEVALKLRMFYYSIETKDYETSKKILNSLYIALSKYNGKDAETIKGEVEQIDKIYLQKDISLLPELIDAYENCEDDGVKSLLCFRIAKLYYFSKDEEFVDKYLNLAKEHSLNENAKNSIDSIIKNHGELA